MLGFQPAIAQDATTDPIVAQTQLETARITAETALITARNASTAAKTAPLTPLAGSNKVTLGDGAGAMEAWLLSSGTIEDAAGVIKASIATGAPNGNLLLLAGDEAFDFRLLLAVRTELGGVDTQINQATSDANDACTAKAPAKFVPLMAAAAIGAIGSLLSTDTEVRGLSVDASHRLLVTALANKLAGRRYIPSQVSLPDTAASAIDASLQKLQTDMAAAIEAKGCISKIKKPSAGQTAASAEVDAAKTRYTDFMTTLTKASDAGKVRLADALALEAIAGTHPLLVRVYIDKAGGTLLSRKNLWTAFGASAVGVTGGLVSSFTVTDPVTGQVKAAGVVTCRTGLYGLRSVHKAGAAAGACRLET